MDDITPATRRMTYAELAEARGITTGSAEQLARRRRWPRQLGNDGMVRVTVPLGEDHVIPRHKGPMKVPDIGEGEGDMTPPDIGEVIGQAVREAVAPLAAQLEQERGRADRLWLELLEARVSERMAERVAAEAVELRKRADDATTAERVARAEADGLRAELGARREWGLRRRLRWALRGR